ncbi:hypothetical protein [Thermobifida halotolerans]|uniref:hypothetical protein n=1 Tax=Thermobifida halotolerans TaxID=483545 RepID=UPI000AF5B5C1|nr:hypothetical protein [Thermobifida halotolerans]
MPDRTAPRVAALTREADALADHLAAVLIRLGHDPEQVRADLTACQGLPVPDTSE